MIKIVALKSDEFKRVTEGAVYLAEVSDGGKELIIIDDDTGYPSSVAYDNMGYENDEEYMEGFTVAEDY